MMKMRIRNKLLLSICLLIMLSLFGQILFNQFFSKQYFIYRQKKIINETFRMIKSGYDDLDDIRSIGEKLHDAYSIKTVIMEDGEEIFSSGEQYLRGPRPPKPMNMIFRNAEFSTDPEAVYHKGRGPVNEKDRLQLSGSFFHDGKEVKVLLVLNIEPIENHIIMFTQVNIMISLIVLISGILVALRIAQNITTPITDIELVSKKIASLDFSDKADENSSSIELADLAKSINIMSDQLDSALRRLNQANEKLQKDIDYKKQVEALRRNFIASASHEMKTPLALLQIYTENLKSDVEGIDKDYYCDTILEETEKLNQMVSELMEISSIESGFILLQNAAVDLSALCLDIMQQYDPIFKSYETDISIDDGLVIIGDTKYLERTIKNLINNAVQHTKDGKRITVKLYNAGDTAVLEIHNQGETIPEEDLEHLWDAFYQVDKARTSNKSRNVGLGLYIVKTIIEKHNGSYSIRNCDDGVLVSIQLRLQNDTDFVNIS